MSDVVRESAATYGATLRPWTVDEYYLAAETGVFEPDEKLELIRGEVIQKESPQKSPHATAIQLVVNKLRKLFPESEMRVQLPLRLDLRNEPEPDVLLVRGVTRDYSARHPSGEDVLLVIEISDTTIRVDRGRKAPLYAEFGIPEYWIVNLRDEQLEVYREPVESGYQSRQDLKRGQSVDVMLTGNVVDISDLLP